VVAGVVGVSGWLVYALPVVISEHGRVNHKRPIRVEHNRFGAVIERAVRARTPVSPAHGFASEHEFHGLGKPEGSAGFILLAVVFRKGLYFADSIVYLYTHVFTS
jgi:hypothetical protein